MRRSLFTLLVACAAAFLVSGTATAQQKFIAHLDAAQEVPATPSTGNGVCVVTLNAAETSIGVNCTFTGLTSNLQADHIHANAAPGVNAGILFGFNVTGGTSGTFTAGPFAVTPAQVANMRSHLWYINLHSVNFPGGEIRGQLKQANTPFDLDGDGRTDISVFRQSANTFFTLMSLSNTLQSNVFGSGAGDNWLNNTYDFDGDGRGDPLLVEIDATNRAVWTILQTGTNTIRNVQWGDFTATVGDTLAMGDYDGDGRQDIAVYRRLNGQWSIIQSSNGAQRFEFWGASTGAAATGDQPCVGDYDGDGISDLTVVRNESGQRVFYIRQSATGTLRSVIFGSSTTDGFFFFAQIDIDGDGKQDIAVNRTVGTQRVHLIQRSSDGVLVSTPWGASATGSTVFWGDYDGDGKTDYCARVLAGGVMTWNILQSSNGAHRSVNWGMTGDQ
jgi:hypothetical protein